MHREELVIRVSLLFILLKINLIVSPALHLAALHGHAEAVDYLLHEEVDFMYDQLGLSPLDYAKRGKNLSIITRLESKIPSSLNGHSD